MSVARGPRHETSSTERPLGSGTATFDPALEMAAGTEHGDLAGGALVRATGHYRLPILGDDERWPRWRVHEGSSHVSGFLFLNEPPALVERDSPKRGAQVLPPGKMKVIASVELDIGDIGTEVAPSDVGRRRRRRG